MYNLGREKVLLLPFPLTDCRSSLSLSLHLSINAGSFVLVVRSMSAAERVYMVSMMGTYGYSTSSLICYAELEVGRR